jgi:hypothetical protein
MIATDALRVLREASAAKKGTLNEAEDDSG